MVPASVESSGCPSLRYMRAAVAAVWLLTGVLVLHPYYREVGLSWLAPLGLPGWLMWATCAGEVVLALRLLLRPWTTSLVVLQIGAMATFTVILAFAEPMLLVHPFGMLTKNLPMIGLILATRLVETEGWTPRALWTLRVGMAVVWLTEGIGPKMLFQQPLELVVVANSGLVPGDPGTFLFGLGVAQAISGVAALTLPRRAAAVLLAGQGLAVVILPLLVSWQDPLLWVHPFGPMTKNIPICVGSWVAAWRLSRSS
ncbi:hypothetical protein LBMAG42_34710 [Deltaproteobacteria bacterium]|nr:hypothetical protein LBMAG42_34710 [Deltaproteobacteria bacterium]